MKVGWALVGGLLLGATQAEAGGTSRAHASADGERSIRMTEEAGRCTIEVRKGNAVEWSLERCLGGVDDLYFVSRDGQRFWVLRTLPQKPPKPAKGKPAPWWKEPVASLYDREGTELRVVAAKDVMSGREQAEVRHLGRHFKWLEGVVGVPGSIPRVTGQDEVEFETVGRRTVRLSFGTEG